MDLKQIKADRANGVLISSCTWDAVLDYAINARNNALEEAAVLFPQPYMEYFGENIQEAIRAKQSKEQPA